MSSSPTSGRTVRLLASLSAIAVCTSHLLAQLQQHIVFASYRDGNYEIYRMLGNGQGQTRLTFNEANDTCPQWSPDGQTIIFVSERDGNAEIYSMPADGGEQTNLTRSPARDERPVWSSDGSKIVWPRQVREGQWSLWTMDADGGDPRPLTRPKMQMQTQPACSPDGEWIAFQGQRDGVLQIYKVRYDGSQLKQLANSLPGAKSPTWSPDGEWISYTSAETGDLEIWVMRADGTGRVRLTQAAGPNEYPVWSPNGAEILFVSRRDGNAELYSIRPDGTGEKNLTNNPADDFYQSWSDDGEYIVFTSFRDGPSEVYVMDRHGAQAQPLSSNRGSDDFPSVGPRSAVPIMPVVTAAPPPPPPRGMICFDRRYDFLHRGPDLRQDGSGIFVVNPDGTNEREVPIGPPPWPLDPAISPDGTRLAFMKGPNAENRELWLCDIGGGNETRLTGPGPNADPNWSPDGNRILFRFRLREEADRPLPGRRTYAWINTDGSGFQELPVSAYDAALSRDGQHIVWSICETDKPPDYKDYAAYLWVSDANGGNLRQLTRGEPYVHEGAEWSPDGTTIAFVRSKIREPGRELRLVPVDGGQPPRTVLEDIRADVPDLAWSPDGREIAFTSAAGRWGPNRVGFDVWVVTLGPPAPPVRQVNGAIRGLSAALAQECCHVDWR